MYSDTKYWTNELKALAGGVIENPIYADSEGEEFWGLSIKMPDGSTTLLWIMRDEEGNGPGAVDIVPNFEHRKRDGIEEIRN